MDTDRIDLNLMVTLEALLAERNVSRAAQRLNVSQPALSARLNRLRHIFRDPLLLPAQRGMVPTLRALELQDPLHRALEGLRQVVVEGAPFDASTVSGTVAISGSDYVQYSVLMPLVRVLRAEAPSIRVAWRNLDLSAVHAQMERGEVHVALMTPESAPDSLRSVPLYHERYVAIVRREHPRVRGTIDLDLFCDLEHVIVSTQGGGFRGPTDLILEAAERRRDVVLSVPAFLLVPEIVANSDMIAVVPQRIARDHTHRLQVMETPVVVPGFDIAMVWHDRTTTHPIQRWLRERIVDAARTTSEASASEA